MKANNAGKVSRDSLGDFSARESTMATADHELLRSYQSLTVMNLIMSTFSKGFRYQSQSAEMTTLVHSPWNIKDTADDHDAV